MKHTPEPWQDCGDYILGADGNEVAVWTGEWGETPMSIEDIARVVACVNACAGMALEDIARIPAMLEQYSILVRKVAHGCTDANCSQCDNP
jgi:hypothetical protein